MRTSIAMLVVFVLALAACTLVACGPKQPSTTPGGMPGASMDDAGAASQPQDQTPAAGTNKQGLTPN